MDELIGLEDNVSVLENNKKEGRIITLQPRFVNTNLFCEAANNFRKYKCYTKAPENTRAFNDFWEEEDRRCKEGYSVGGVKLTGVHYFYLNYCPIKKTLDDGTITKKINRKELDFPRFLDLDYYFFHEYQNAREDGEGMIVAKARRKGFSFKVGAINVHEYNFFRDATCVIAAYDKTYALNTFDMCLTYADFLNEHTAWRKARLIDLRKERIKSGFEERDDLGNKLIKGYKSEILVKTFMDDPSKGIGASASIYNFEEAGKWPKLIDAYSFSQDTWKEGNQSTGIPLVWGTGGDMEGDTVDFEKMFYNPESYGLRAYTNIWDEGATTTTCGFFVPDSWYKPPFVDEDGNSNLKAAEEDLKNQRDKLKRDPKIDRKKYDKFITQRPLVPKEAFLQVSGNSFPTALLQEQETFLSTNIAAKEYGTRGRLKFEQNRVKFEADPELKEANYPHTEDNKEGCIVIYEHPIVEHGRIPFNLYIAGTDPYVQDEAVTSDSLGSTIIYKKIYRALDTYEIVVAEYTGRPETSEDYYENVRMLLLYYNARDLYENQFRDFSTYLRSKNCEYLLADQPQYIRNIVERSVVQRGKGIHMPSQIKVHGENLIKNWLLTPRDDEGKMLNLHTLQSVNLVRELIRYNRTGNFDRVIAFMLCLILREESINIQAINEEESIIEKEFLRLNNRIFSR